MAATLLIRRLPTEAKVGADSYPIFLLEQAGGVPREGELVATIAAPEGELRWEEDGMGPMKAYWFAADQCRWRALSILDAVREWDGGRRQGQLPRTASDHVAASFRLLEGDLAAVPPRSGGISW